MRTVAWVEVIGLWLVWFYPFLFHAPHVQKRTSITAPGPTFIGLILETAAIFVVLLFPAAGVPRSHPLLLLAALFTGAPAVAMMWTAILHLGRQFRITAGLYHDHKLVQTGPYRIVRHPIYASLLAMTLATGLLWTRWEWLLVALVMSAAGTEIRMWAEDRLLASRFGSAFMDYRRRTAGYLPFLR